MLFSGSGNDVCCLLSPSLCVTGGASSCFMACEQVLRVIWLLAWPSRLLMTGSGTLFLDIIEALKCRSERREASTPACCMNLLMRPVTWLGMQ